MAGTTVGVIQASFDGTSSRNIEKAVKLVRKAHRKGARIVLVPELFSHPYFCKTQRPEFLSHAETVGESGPVRRMAELAAELGVVIPVSFYERAGNVRFNSVAVIDAGGDVLGVYRKSHIPDGPGYQEKFYFSPGNTGFRVWHTRHGCIGVGICWDQWFPEAARSMALMGADLLLYPTAIGNEPHAPGIDSLLHWRNVMRGHAAANMVPVLAANRVGREEQTDALGGQLAMSFYGKSFVADQTGALAAEADGEDGAVLCVEFDFAEIGRMRTEWGLFRDRRPDLYTPLMSLDCSDSELSRRR